MDVKTDGVGLVENYRTMFNKIIAKDGFDGLIAKMKKKQAAHRHLSAPARLARYGRRAMSLHRHPSRRRADAWLAEDPDPTTADELRALLAAVDERRRGRAAAI